MSAAPIDPPPVDPALITDGDEHFDEADRAMLEDFDRSLRGANVRTVEPVPGRFFEGVTPRPSFEELHAASDLANLDALVKASHGLLAPMRLELNEDDFGAAIIANVLAPSYVHGVEHVKAAPIKLSVTPKIRPLHALPYIAFAVHASAAKLEPIEPPTDADVAARATTACSNALAAFFTHIRNVGWDSFAKSAARADIDGHALIAKEALHFARDEFGLEVARASALVASVAQKADIPLRRLEILTRQVDGELAFWSGESLRKIETEVAAERANAGIEAAKKKEREGARVAPASITKAPRELGAIVLTRDIGDGGAAKFTSDLNFSTRLGSETVREGRVFKCAALPVLSEVAPMPDTLEEQTGPLPFTSWRVAPMGTPIGLNKHDVRCATKTLAPAFVVDAILRRARSVQNAEAPIARERLRNARGGFLAAMALRRDVRSFIERHAAALTIDGEQKLMFAKALHQSIVRGMLVEPVFAAAELRKAARKLKDVTPFAREFFEKLFDRVDDGELMVNGGLGCFIAPGALLDKGGG